jgi:uncharacterized protein (TIGR02284 family)
MTTTSYVATCALLNELIVACHDEVRVQRAAAEIADSHDMRQRLRRSAERRAVFAAELGKIVVLLGGSAPRGGSTAERFRAATLRWRGRLFGDRSEDRAREACARIERRVDELFAAAVRLDLPDRARSAIVRQASELRTERMEFQRIRPAAVGV